jgi:hypothetical protein
VIYGVRSAELHPQCSAEFRLSITKALGDQLGDAIQKLNPAPLDSGTLNELKAESGVYQLYRNDKLVYIGKADKSLPDRLGQHLRKISGRQNISPAEMAFTCLYVAEDLSAVAPETLLIKRFQGDGESPWNTNGFGNKDPGRQRDTTVVKANHFDTYFPIDLDVVIELPPGHQTIKQFLEAVKESLPYNLRYDQVLKGKDGLALADVLVKQPRLTAREVFQLTVEALPSGWQLTALPGYAILYKEAKPYKSALTWWHREPDGPAIETVGQHLVDPGSEKTLLEPNDDED